MRRRGQSRGDVLWLDARRVLLVEWGPLGPGVRWEQSRANLQQLVPADFTGTVVVTGFIATDTQGLQTTLGRNGSDFSASIFGSLLDAAEIVIKPQIGDLVINHIVRRDVADWVNWAWSQEK